MCCLLSLIIRDLFIVSCSLPTCAVKPLCSREKIPAKLWLYRKLKDGVVVALLAFFFFVSPFSGQNSQRCL